MDGVYVNDHNDNSASGMRRPAFLPSQERVDDEGHAGCDDFGSVGDPRTGAASMPSDSGTEDNKEADSNSRVSFLSKQTGRQSAWGLARTIRGTKGPYGEAQR